MAAGLRSVGDIYSGRGRGLCQGTLSLFFVVAGSAERLLGMSSTCVPLVILHDNEKPNRRSAFQVRLDDDKKHVPCPLSHMKR